MRAENMNFFDDLKNNFKQKLNEAVDQGQEKVGRFIDTGRLDAQIEAESENFIDDMRNNFKQKLNEAIDQGQSKVGHFIDTGKFDV